MITYIKLGPIGDAFSSKELGLYLYPGNASEIDTSILNGRLSKFLLTGFLVEISKLEYDNIKLLNLNTSNIPNSTTNIGQPYILEPVEDVINTNPNEAVLGKRYLVIQPVQGSLSAWGDYIIETDITDYIYIKPENGMILPVYNWGISLHYVGTYPSGKWDISDDKLAQLSNTIVTDDGSLKDYIDSLIAKEIQVRKDQDAFLKTLIDNINKVVPANKAIDISFNKTGTIFAGTNVQAVLQELSILQQSNTISFNSIYQQLNSIFADGIAFQFLNGIEAPTEDLGTWNSVFLDTVGKNLYKKTGDTSDAATWELIYEFGADGTASTTLTFEEGDANPFEILNWQDDYFPIYGNGEFLVQFIDENGDLQDRPDISIKRVIDRTDPDNPIQTTIKFDFPFFPDGQIVIKKSNLTLI